MIGEFGLGIADWAMAGCFWKFGNLNPKSEVPNPKFEVINC
jgi:hypothetical protein